MDQVLQHFRAEPFWFTIKAVSAAVSLICLQQTGFFSSGLVPYKGSFHSYTSPKPPPTPAPLMFKMTVDPLRPHPDFSGVQGIFSVLHNTTNIVAYEQANVSGLIVDMMVIANSSTHCFPVNVTATEGASAVSLPQRMTTWLISTGTNILEFMLRRLADLAFFHNSSMSTASMASITTPLTVIAAFVGHRGYLGMKHVREIYRANIELARKLRDKEAQNATLNEGVLLNINRVAILEEIATRADEAKGERFIPLVALAEITKRSIDAADHEAENARFEAGTVRNALEEAAKALAIAREVAHNAMEEAKIAGRKAAEDAKEADRRINAVNDVVDEQRNTITSLRSDKSALERDLQQAHTEATASAEKSKKSLSQKEAEILRGELRNKDQLLKSQGQNTINLQKRMNSLKEQMQNSKPEAVEKLRKQMMDEQQLHKAAVDKAAHIQGEMIGKVEAEKRRMSAEVEAKNDLKKQVGETTRSLETAENKVTLLEAEKAKQADVEAHYRKDLTTRAEAAVKSQEVAEDRIRLLEATMARQAETEAEAKRQLTIQVEEGVRIRDAAEEETAALKVEMAQVKEESKTQVEEAANYQKAAEAKSSLLEAETEARANATRQLEEKLDASNGLLAELKGEMEELDTDYRTAVARFGVAQAAKDAAIRELEAQVGELRSTSSWTDDDALTSPSGLDDPPQRPAVRLPAPWGDSTTTENADTDDGDVGFSIKGASARRDSDGPNDSEAGKNRPNGSSTNLQKVNDDPNDLSQHSSSVATTCICVNCGRKHAPPCKYLGPPYCANCGNNHTGKLNSCRKWCKQCQASHYSSDCPHSKTAPHTPFQAPTGPAAVDTLNDLGNAPVSSPAPLTDQGNQPPVRLSATTPVPVIDASQIPGPQRGVYGAHRYTAPGLRPIRPSPGGFVPIPAAQRHGPSNGRGRGGGRRGGQDGSLSAAESFQRQQRGRSN